MLLLKFYWFVRTAKWERADYETNTFFNKRKGISIILKVTHHSPNTEVVFIKVGDNISAKYEGFSGWLIGGYFKDINKKINKRQKKEQKIEVKKQKKREKRELRRQKKIDKEELTSALNRVCYVEIKFDSERRESKVEGWLKEKKYPIVKYGLRTGEIIYYFQNKDHATEFKMVWG